MDEHKNKRLKKEYATVLAFDVPVFENAAALAAEYNIKVIVKDVIYHLTDDFKLHVKAIKEQRKIDEGDLANFPVRLRVIFSLLTFIFTSKLLILIKRTQS